MYSAQQVWEHRQKHKTGDLGDSSQAPYKATFKYPFYELKKVSLNLIKSDFEDYSVSLNESEDELYAKKYSELDSEAPAIVLHLDGSFYKIVDGRHRVRSYYIRGLTEILAFVAIS